jgi:hypothetical protein
MNARILSLASVAGLLLVSRAFGAPVPLYYDTNGATGGTSTSSTQNFTDSVWSIDPLGLTPTTGYTAGSDVVFSANDGTGTQAVTVTDTESANSFTFDNGTVTLYGSASPNLSLGVLGGLTPSGITVGATVNGATTFDSSLGTVTLGDDQAWDNNSSQALNVNSGVAASGKTLTFAGIGAGAVNLNGQLTGGLNLTDNSTTSTVYLNGENNSFSGTITVNGGTLVYQNQGSLANNNITLENGGALESDTEVFATGNDTLSNNITLGTGGGAVGDVGTSGTDMVFSGTFTGGTGLTIVGGDFLTQADGTSNVGTLNINGGRLLAGTGGIFGNKAVVNVSSILDFGWFTDFSYSAQYGGTLNNTVRPTS